MGTKGRTLVNLSGRSGGTSVELLNKKLMVMGRSFLGSPVQYSAANKYIFLRVITVSNKLPKSDRNKSVPSSMSIHGNSLT